MPNEQPRRVGQYVLLQTLGQGGFSKVKLALAPNGEKVALKVLKKNALALDATARRQVEREIDALSKIQHPNVICLKEIMFDVEYPKKNGRVERRTVVVLEFAPSGELFEFLQFSGCFQESVARTFFHQLVEGLSACHEKGFAHRDLKPENILLDSQFRLKIADFGFATAFGSNVKLSFTECGTKGYMAPEMFSNLRGYDPSTSDVWACGVILFIMLAGFPPFNAPSMADWWFKQLASNRHDLFWQAHCRAAYFSDSAKDLLNKLLTVDPTKRIGLDAVKKHPWYSGSTLTPAAILSEFSRRHEVVTREKQLERLKLEREKAHKAMDNNNCALSDEVFRAMGDEDSYSFVDADSDALPDCVPSSLLFNVDTKMFKQHYQAQQQEEQEHAATEATEVSSAASSLSELSIESSSAPQHLLLRGKSIPIGEFEAKEEYKFTFPPPVYEQQFLSHTQFRLRADLPTSSSDATTASASSLIHRLVSAFDSLHADSHVKTESWKIKATLTTTKGSVTMALNLYQQPEQKKQEEQQQSQQGEFIVVATKLQGNSSAFRQAYAHLLLNLEDLLVL